MAAGRRTWFVSVIVLGTVVLWMVSRRLRVHRAKDKIFLNRLNQDQSVESAFNKAVGREYLNEMKKFVKDFPDGVMNRDPIKLPNVVVSKRTTYLKTVSHPDPKVPRLIKVSKPAVKKVIPFKNVNKASKVPTPLKCNYRDPPGLNSFKHEPQKWQTVAKRTIMVFSAYIDQRKELDGPIIRILASGKQTRFGHSGKVSCVLWLKNRTGTTGVPTEATYNVIYDSRLHPSMYTAHFILCDLKPLKVTTDSVLGVSVVPEHCGTTSNVLKLTYMKPISAKNNTFSLCLSPMYGNYNNAPALIEHFEMHKILGVHRITVYVLSVGATVGSILKKYQSEGLVDLVNWKYPYNKVLCDYFAQREALNDCLYRNMGRTRFLAFADLDEIITPRKTLVWDAMMSRLYKSKRGAFLFQHAYFLNNHQKSSKPTLLTQTVFSRPKEVFPAGKVRCKSIYETEKAVQVDIHFPHTLLPGVDEYVVPPDEAVLHHYRKEPMQIFHDKKRKFTYVNDTYMVNYASRIRKAFSKRLEMFHIV